MLESQLLGNEQVELAGLFLAEYARLNDWFRTGGNHTLTMEEQVSRGDEMSRVVGRVYDVWTERVAQAERDGRRVTKETETRLNALTDALRRGAQELEQLRTTP